MQPLTEGFTKPFNTSTFTHTCRVRVLDTAGSKGTTTVRKSHPAPSPQTKASEKVLGGFFGRLLSPCYPLCPEPSLYMCVSRKQ